MQHVNTKITLATLILGATACLAETARADGYYYVPQPYYVAPPVAYSYQPAYYFPAPVVVYQPAPVTAFYAPAPGRVRERWSDSPHRSRYRYEYEFPNGVEYKYRYKRDGGYVRIQEKWDD